MKLLSRKKEPEVEIWRIVSLSILAQKRWYEKACFEENTKGVAGPALNTEFMGLYQHKHWQFEVKRMETRQKERLPNSLEFTGQDERAVPTRAVLQEGKMILKLICGSSDLNQTDVLLYLDTSLLELILERIKTFRDAGMEWLYLTCVKDVILGAQGQNAMDQIVSSQNSYAEVLIPMWLYLKILLLGSNEG